MADVWYEKHKSQARRISQSGESLPLEFFCFGPATSAEVEDLAYARTNPVEQGLIRLDIRIEVLGGRCYDVHVEYGVGDPSEAIQPGDLGGEGGGGGGGGGESGSEAPADDDNLGPGYSGEIGIETIHITQSLETIFALRPGDIPANYLWEGNDLVVTGGGTLAVSASWTVQSGNAPTGDIGKRIRVLDSTGNLIQVCTIIDASGGQWTLEPNLPADGTYGWSMVGSGPDCGGAIGDTGDTVYGCEIPVPVGHWQRQVKRRFFSMAYLDTLHGLVGKWNRKRFYGRAPKTVQYLGPQYITGQGSKGLDTVLTHRFFYRKRETNIPPIGTGANAIRLPEKHGMDYFWTRYKKGDKPSVQIPEAVYVERVSKLGDFALIEIGE